MKTQIELKHLALAYELACEFDYSPGMDQKEEAEGYLAKKIDDRVLNECSGLRPDELARAIVRRILNASDVELQPKAED